MEAVNEINQYIFYDLCMETTFMEVIYRPMSWIRRKSGSGKCPCLSFAWFMRQMPSVQIEFMELVNAINQSILGIAYMMYKASIP